MKTIKSFIMITAAIAAISCTKEINPETVSGSVNLQPMKFQASSAEEIATTKAALDGKSIVWNSGDAISIFDGTNNNRFETSGSGSSVVFEGEADANASGYYALYPYQKGAVFHKEKATINSKELENYISLTVPTVQTATAGSFDPQAFLSIAKPEADGTFAFKNLLGLIQFRLEDATDVVSVTLSGNNHKETLAGEIYAYFDANGRATNTYGKATSSTVTLKGEFLADTDYYFAVRSCAFTSGVIVSVEYKNGETSTRKYLSSTKTPTDKNGNAVTLGASTLMKLGTLKNFKSETPNDLYIAYLHGYDLTFGNVTINKTTHPEAILTSSDPNTNTSITTDAVYFVEPSGGTVKLSNPADGEHGKVIVIGRYADQRSKVMRNAIYYIRSTAKSDDLLLLANIDYTDVAGITSYQFLNNNSDNTLQEDIIFYNCKLKIPNKTRIVEIGSNRPIGNIQFINCDCELVGGDNENNLLNVAQGMSTSLVVKNNIFWNPGETAVTQFKFIINTKGITEKLVIDSNTLIGAYTNWSGYAYVAYNEGSTINDVTITNNLFYLPNHASGYTKVICKAPIGTLHYRNNLAAIAEGSTGAIETSPSAPEDQEKIINIKGGNPFEGGKYDLANCIFIPGAEYSQYGAKR